MSLTITDLLSALRNRVGNPDNNVLSDRVLQDYLTRGTEFLADELDYNIVDATIALVASTQEYTLPSDFLWMVRLEWNSQLLTPSSVYQWDRDGTNWRNATAGTPREYALQSDRLILYPPPNAAAVSTDSTVSYRYVAYPPSLANSGTATPHLFDEDQMIAVYYAASEWWGLHPEADPTGRKLKTCQDLFTSRLAKANERALNANLEYRPRVRVETRRIGAAR